ncbi:MAG: hypothetical protein SNH13_02340 [Rikenellaceae bacterium]
MKTKILALCAVLFCAVLSFSSCSKDYEPTVEPVYTGALLGSWDSTSNAYDAKMTLNSDGTYSVYCVESNGEWYEVSGSYYVQDEKVLAMIETSSETESGTVSFPEEYQYFVYFYIASVDASTLSVSSIGMGEQGNTTVDFDSMSSIVDYCDQNPNDLVLDTYTK